MPEDMRVRLARGSLRAVLLVIALGVVSLAMHDRPALREVYVSLLALPFTLLGPWLEGRLEHWPRPAFGALVWVLALGALLFAHFQSIYAAGVLGFGGIGGGAEALAVEWQRLGRSPEDLYPLTVGDFDLTFAAGAAIGLVVLTWPVPLSTPVVPLARWVRVRSRDATTAVVLLMCGSWVLATFVATLFAARHDTGILPYFWLVALIVGFFALGSSSIAVCVRTIEGFVFRGARGTA